MPLPLYSLVYRSEVALAGTASDIDRAVLALVEAAGSRNRGSGLSGALVLASNTFVQAIEGPLAGIEATFERICRDMRHRRLELLEFAAREERVFGAAAMARLAPDGELGRLVARLEAVRDVRTDPGHVRTLCDVMRAALPGAGGAPAPQ